MEKTTFTRNFGVKDSKGRAIGASVKWWTEVIPRSPESILTDTRYVMVVHATRNGISYGASQPLQYFTNPAKRLKACNMYLDSAAKRAVAKTRKIGVNATTGE